MKINKHNTALHFLDEHQPLDFGMSAPKDADRIQLEMMAARVRDAFTSMRKKCITGKRQYISDPFEDAYDRSRNRLTLNMQEDVIKQSGTFIFRHKAGGGKNTIFYSMDCGPTPDGYRMKGSIIAFSKMKHEPVPTLFAAYFIDRANNSIRYYCNEADGNGAFELFVDMFYLCLFLRYCQIETKIIAPGRKGEHAGSKYLNETKSDVEIVDSSWFTTIIRSEGFGVRGHFRLQPYKTGKKLIYIQPFEKHGYTRKAKVLTHGENDHPTIEQTDGDQK